VPQAVRRELDGRSVYTAPGTERYATHGQLSMEEVLCQRAQRTCWMRCCVSPCRAQRSKRAEACAWIKRR
jgi:hypothetical protein